MLPCRGQHPLYSPTLHSTCKIVWSSTAFSTLAQNMCFQIMFTTLQEGLGFVKQTPFYFQQHPICTDATCVPTTSQAVQHNLRMRMHWAGFTYAYSHEGLCGENRCTEQVLLKHRVWAWSTITCFWPPAYLCLQSCNIHQLVDDCPFMCRTVVLKLLHTLQSRNALCNAGKTVGVNSERH